MKRLRHGFRLLTTRFQMFVGFLAVTMVVVFVTVSGVYIVLSNLLEKNAENYMAEISSQVNGRLEALLNEVNVSTLQLITDERIQKMLEKDLVKENLTFEERANVRNIVLNATGTSFVIDSIEIYARDNVVYPLVSRTIHDRLSRDTIEAIEEHKGALHWIGKDPANEEYLIAARQIRLYDRKYADGGYLIVRVKPIFLEFLNDEIARMEGSFMILSDQQGNLISNSRAVEDPTYQWQADADIQKINVEGRAYMLAQKGVPSTDWQLKMLIPYKEVNQGTDILRSALIGSGVLGILLSALVSFGLASLITKPIRNLIRTMSQWKKGQTLLVHTRPHVNKEINHLYRTYNGMAQHINYLIDMVYEKELIKSRAEIKALQSQLHPHFLFNTLETLYWSLIQNGEEEMAHYVLTLADLYRYTVNPKGNQGMVTVAEELQHVERYLSIMELRMKRRIRWHIDIQVNDMALYIPKLTIQPIVENAIVHGIEPRIEGGFLEIQVIEKAGDVWLIISDNGLGMPGAKLSMLQESLMNAEDRMVGTKGTGIGLYTVHQLIRMCFGMPFGLSIESREGEGTTVKLRIPGRTGL
ncbi:sensor histidine kinase [Marinicrinis sediminis]|uniref:histidine kinase n=1 Tax=Marinicrinis sediminis TaxID=1652465 RepID=A0ABW5RD81_9BACL